MAERTFGHITGYPPGSTFADRRELSEARVHRPRRAGICGSAKEGAESVVLSGGYEDDLDRGDTILYTGAGGRDRETGRQVQDQALTRGNRALATSAGTGRPVRVVRGVGAASRYAPDEGYRYDGLYRAEVFWQEPGASGFLVWRFRLVRAEVEA